MEGRKRRRSGACRPRPDRLPGLGGAGGWDCVGEGGRLNCLEGDLLVDTPGL